MRPYLLFVSGAAGAVGLAFAGDMPVSRTLLGFLPLFFSYGLGQALTDCFQTDTDSLSSPYRPLVRGLVTRRQVLSVSLVALTACIVVLAGLNPVILAFGVASVAGLLTYTPFKRRWWGGPPWNSWIVALLPVMGRLVDAGYSPASFFVLADGRSLSFFLAVLAVFFAYANFVVMGYFKDVSADLATGYRTFVVAFGWRAGRLASDAAGAAAAVLTAWSMAAAGTLSGWRIVLWAAAAAVGLWAQIGIHRVDDEKRAHGPIANVVRCLVLYCLAIVVGLRPEWAGPAALFYLLLEAGLRLRPEESQV
jgi:4-hydroxybenzoate polyprenyltransferase